MSKIAKLVFIGFVGLFSTVSFADVFDDVDLDDLGVNHETQVAAACTEEFGISYPAAACIIGELSVEEVEKCFEDGFGGEGCFGDNNTLVRLLENNMSAAEREDGDANRAIRVITGISIRDIEDDGILGGENSEARKACDAIASIFGGGC